MQKPMGVIVAAVLLGLAAFSGTFTVLGLIGVGLLAPQSLSQDPHLFRVIMASAAAVIGVPVLCAWIVAIGLLRSRNWARIGAVWLGSLMTLTGLLLAVGVTVSLLITHVPSRAMMPHGRLIASVAVYLLVAAIGIWMVLYFRQQFVKAFFRSAASLPGALAYPVTQAHDGGAYVTAGGSAPVVEQPAVLYQTLQPSGPTYTVHRVVVIISAVLNVLGALSLFVMAAMGMPLSYLGFLLRGHAAAAALVCLALIQAFAGVGLFRRFVPAYYAALALQGLGALSMLSLLIPAMRARTVASSAAIAARLGVIPANPQMAALQHSVQSASMVMYGLLTPLLFVFFIWALWRDLAAIRASTSIQGGTL